MLSLINTGLFVILVLAFVFALKNPAYGYCFFIAVRILIPEVARSPLTDVISFNTTIIFVIIVILIYKKRKVFTNVIKKDDFSRTLVVFSLYAIITLPLSDYGDIAIQYKNTIQFFLTDILPIIIFISVIHSKRDFEVLVRTFLVATIVCCIYSIFTTLINFNPLVAVFKLAFDKSGEFIMSDFDTDLTTGRGFSSSGTFVSANGFGYFISMSIPICMYLIARKYQTKLSITVLLLLIINLFLCKKRSPLVSMGVFWIAYMFMDKNKDRCRHVIDVVLGGFFAILLIETIPALSSISNMLESSLYFWDDNILEKNDVGGSSWELRVRQTFYPFVEVKDNLIFGHGYEWCSWYLGEFELHPILYGFETILSTAVCEFGIVGYFIYYMVLKKSYKYSKPFYIEGINYQLLNLIAEIVLLLATGLNYFYFWGFGIVLLRKGDLLMLKKHV